MNSQRHIWPELTISIAGTFILSNWKELLNEVLCELFEQSSLGFNNCDLMECQLVYDIPNHDESIALSIYKLAEVCPSVEIFKGGLHANHWNALGEAAKSYWKQLKHLPEPQWSMYNDHREFRRILLLLPSFINLTHLTVTPTYDIPILTDFNEVISQYPNLMKDESSPGYFNRYDVLSMQAHSKLKIPDVVTMFHCDTFEYIMRKFPNLGCCSVNLHLDEDYNCHMVESIDRLKELFKNQNVIKEVYLNMPTSFGVYHLTYVLLSECEGLGKLTRKFLNAGPVMNSSLITLKLIFTKLQPEVLSAYSCALPRLHNLIIELIYMCTKLFLFVIDMPRTKFSHLQVHLESNLFSINMTGSEIKDTSDKSVLLEIALQKSGLK
ncbi:hypothetical protein AB4K20DRAFT_1970163 [Rhizopus microsporus]